MDQIELLQVLVAALERLGIEYLITGSIATTYYGEPRMTADVDVVVRMLPDQAPAFCRAFPAPDFYVDEDAARAAAREHDQFNIIHAASGLKVDVIVADDSSFNRSRFARARRVRPTAATQATFASPEDVIIRKLEYFREGGSDKHLRDIAGILKIDDARIDYAYIERWVAQFGLEAEWRAVRDRAGQGST